MATDIVPLAVDEKPIAVQSFPMVALSSVMLAANSWQGIKAIRRQKAEKNIDACLFISHLLFSNSAFFNFIKSNIDSDFQNPCDTPLMRKMFRPKPVVSWEVIEKDVIDEIIFRTDKTRNRLMLELMARGGMRIGEVLKLSPADVHDRKLILRDPKIGREREVIFIPQKRR